MLIFASDSTKHDAEALATIPETAIVLRDFLMYHTINSGGNKMKKIEDFTLDELKEVAGEEHASFMDEKAKDMLDLVKKYESEQDYWFVKYYLAPSFAIFTMGAMAANMNENAWIKPDQEISDKMKKSVKGMIGSMLNKELLAIFKDKEELTVRLFAYGTHLVQSEMEEARKEEERLKAERADWTYVVIALKKNVDGGYTGGVAIAESEDAANEWFDKKDKEPGFLLMLMHVSPYLKESLENINNPEELIIEAAKNKENCSMLRFNDEVVKFTNRH